MIKKYTIVLIAAVIGVLSYITITHEYEVLEKQQVIKQERIKQLYCLAQNIYFEARGQSIDGQKAVALVTMNRTNHPKYPATVCDVVYQGRVTQNGTPMLHKCQFSWFCDGKNKSIRNEAKWEQAMEIAADVYDNYDDIDDVTNGAIMYHANYVRPYWNKHYVRTVKIESHIFYK
jgi:spore germination cell wall hydrolase CwlJ-like protein